MQSPVVTEKAFNCPHCGVLTTQYWHQIWTQRIESEGQVPFFPPDDFEDQIKSDDEFDDELKDALIEHYSKIGSGSVFIKGKRKRRYVCSLENVFASQCYHCDRWALWVHKDLVHPPERKGPIPNQDLPEKVLSIVEEARSIVSESPKGAAAMLRLAVEMLCEHLGESANSLNSNIASLVEKGLNPVVQRSLDVVRVIGNESVHPGQIDLNDDRETALRLFKLINVIAEQMITQPKQVDELYSDLPPEKREGIEQRDKGS